MAKEIVKVKNKSDKKLYFPFLNFAIDPGETKSIPINPVDDILENEFIELVERTGVKEVKLKDK